MRFTITLIVCLISLQIVSGQISISKEPSWIVKEDYNTNAQLPENGVNGGVQVLLFTEQVNVELEESYVKNAIKAVEFSGIQLVSNIVAEYDPTYQELRFHTIEVIRDGVTINKLKLEDIQTARRETNAENFIYDGTISAFVNVTDVRLGDIVSYSYSVKGFNPIQKNKFSSSFILNSTNAIDRISVHLFTKHKVNYKILNSDREVNHKIKEGIHYYEWSDENVPAILIEEQNPSWFIQNATLLVSEYESWEEVIDWGKDIYTFSAPLNQELQTIVEDIVKEHKSEGDRIKAALEFVQNEVRYLAVSSGIGGYMPNSPNKVITQRFGDCKDKSVLLVTLLNAMDIEAYPTLVNTALRQILPSLLPSSKVFDHCIVKTVDQNGTILWYDPTLSDQGGTYNKIYLPDYRYGLVLDENMNTLDTITSFANNVVETYNTFKIEELGKGAELEVSTFYNEGEADFIRAVFRNNSMAVIEQELASFYTDFYGSVTAIEPPRIVDDSINNRFTLLERYQIDSIWRPSVENPGQINVSIYPTNITSSLTMPSQLNRTTPYALSFPMVRRQNIVVELPMNFGIRPEEVTINSDFFYYDFNSTYDRSSNTLSLNYYYKSQDDHVPDTKFDEYYRDMVQLDQKLGYVVYANKNGRISTDSFAFSLGSLFGIGFVLLLIVALVITVVLVLLRRKKII